MNGLDIARYVFAAVISLGVLAGFIWAFVWLAKNKYRRLNVRFITFKYRSKISDDGRIVHDNKLAYELLKAVDGALAAGIPEKLLAKWGRKFRIKYSQTGENDLTDSHLAWTKKLQFFYVTYINLDKNYVRLTAWEWIVNVVLKEYDVTEDLTEMEREQWAKDHGIL